jgi:hypothetical protein
MKIPRLMRLIISPEISTVRMATLSCRLTEGEKAMMANVDYSLILTRKKEKEERKGLVFVARIIIRLRFCGTA